MEKPFLRCIGHRGAMGHEPENTLRSIRRAIELGAPCVEIDVQWVDGHLMVFHDDRLERTTNGSGSIMEQSFEALRLLDAGKGERIPTLEEVCEQIGKNIGLNIELKGLTTAAPAADAIASLVKAGWNRKSLLVSSFHREELLDMYRLDPAVQLGILSQKALATDLEFAVSLGAFSINPSLRYVNRCFVEEAHRHGLKVYVYTVNHPAEMARLYAMGVDGVFTNFPERVLAHYSQNGDPECW